MVVDVYSISRTTKICNLFDLVRFLRVVDVQELLTNVCSMWFGNIKVFATIATCKILLE